MRRGSDQHLHHPVDIVYVCLFGLLGLLLWRCSTDCEWDGVQQLTLKSPVSMQQPKTFVEKIKAVVNVFVVMSYSSQVSFQSVQGDCYCAVSEIEPMHGLAGRKGNTFKHLGFMMFWKITDIRFVVNSLNTQTPE